MTCSIADCLSPAVVRGWCRKHYRRWMRHGDPLVVKKAPNGTYSGCDVDGCTRPHRANGLCAVHHGRQRRHGNPLAGGAERLIGESRAVRHRRFVDVRGADECWPWTGTITPNGYGRFFHESEAVAAHRAALELATGEPVPDGLDVDHRCHNLDPACPGGHGCLHRRCCNPAHLEPVTRSVNMLRAFARTGPA